MPPSTTTSSDSSDNTNSNQQQKVRTCALLVVIMGILWMMLSQITTPETIVEDSNRLMKRMQLEINILEKELKKKLNESISSAYLTEETHRVGYRLAKQGVKAYYPVIMVPGFVTTGLEVWGGEECARKHFRQRLWAALGMVQSILTERDCWNTHMKLDPITGLDPGRVKIRAASGFEAADYFMATYWVWGKLIESLADVGYNPSNMVMMPYDWRLAFPLMEKRDAYFTRLKNEIETLHKTTGQKVVMTSHSMGALVVHYFFAWATNSEKNGGCGKDCIGEKKWVDKHVHAYINIAGPHLGVPKAATALLSGEMSDTAMLGSFGELIERFFGRRLRTELFSTWGSLWTMLPMGGEALWGVGVDMCDDDNEERSSDDPLCPKIYDDDNSNLSPIIARTDLNVTTDSDADNSGNAEEEEEEEGYCGAGVDPTNGSCPSNMTLLLKDFASNPSYSVEEVVNFLQAYGSGYGTELSASKLYDLYNPTSNPPIPQKSWHDPTKTPLPNAKNMRIYCLYGFGINTERAYYYKHNSGANHSQEPPIILDPSINDKTRNVSSGVRYADGDRSVPLISLGYMCADAWQRKDSGLNPSQLPVVTREYKHEARIQLNDPGRGGPKSGEHVDALGNEHIVEDFLRIVTDYKSEDVMNPRIVSDIEKIAAKINAHPKGGIFIGRQQQKQGGGGFWSRG